MQESGSMHMIGVKVILVIAVCDAFRKCGSDDSNNGYNLGGLNLGSMLRRGTCLRNAIDVALSNWVFLGKFLAYYHGQLNLFW